MIPLINEIPQLDMQTISLKLIKIITIHIRRYAN